MLAILLTVVKGFSTPNGESANNKTQDIYIINFTIGYKPLCGPVLSGTEKGTLFIRFKLYLCKKETFVCFPGRCVLG